MQQLKIIDAIENELPIDICWHNLSVADKFKNFAYFIPCALGWLDLNPGKTFQDLEKELRDKDFDTHLIATNKRDITGVDLKMPNNSDAEYECIFSCRPKEDALKEILQHSNSYEENFQKLSQAGSYKTIASANEIGDPSLIELNKKEKNEMQLVRENKKKYQLETISAENYINAIINDCQTNYGITPTSKVMGMGPSGGPVFGLFINENTIISNIGYSLSHDSNGKLLMRLVNLATVFGK